VSTDGGAAWADANLDPDNPGRYAWRGWTFDWDAKPGKHVLLVRATDSDGNAQPAEQRWNYKGMGNNMTQHIEVLVSERT
ncbi:MAG: sulfite oxidase, partial [Ardenticatenaceae bacterium]